MLTPSFHFKILEDFVPVFNEQASIMVQCLTRDKRDQPDGETFNMYPYITKCTLDIICGKIISNWYDCAPCILAKLVSRKYFPALEKNLGLGIRISRIQKFFLKFKRCQQTAFIK